MVTFGSPDRPNSKLLGEQLLELELKGEKTLGCGGPWVSTENLLSPPQTVGGLLQGMGPRMIRPEWYFRAFHQRA